MEEQGKYEVDLDTLMKLGLPDELVNKIKDSSTPSINNHAEGGKGGQAIGLTYVDNYSSLLLVYTFLLNYSHNHNGNRILNDALLSTLKTAMKEQQEYRRAFLETVKSLNNKN